MREAIEAAYECLIAALGPSLPSLAVKNAKPEPAASKINMLGFSLRQGLRFGGSFHMSSGKTSERADAVSYLVLYPCDEKNARTADVSIHLTGRERPRASLGMAFSIRRNSWLARAL